ncbi:alpha-L-rhamnosidase [Paenibacillus sp. y28]|uniref:alpha-L-rhamnosidase n=1 Tax=Paenibacillus sp. y28 TaxID=3129110 RepID=UPI003019F0CC
MQVSKMVVESTTCPLGVDVERPAFGWSFTAGAVRSERQTAYRIIVSAREEQVLQGAGDVWDSGKTAGGNSVHIVYDGLPLQSRVRYFWRVQVWDQDGSMIESPVSWWEMALLKTSDWSARWISEPEAAAKDAAALPLFRHEFMLHAPIAKARAYVCGLGQFELRLNGAKVSDHVLEPGWTNYNKTCLYCVYDITDHLAQGANAVGVMLGNGFYHVTGGRYKKFKGSFGSPRCLVQLEIEYTDGTTVTVASSGEWRTGPGPVTFACIYGGEDFDANRVEAGWDEAGFAESDSWQPAAEAAPPAGRLKAQAIAPLKVMKTFKPAAITEPAPGVYVVDFGQNFSGWVELAVKGPKGSQVKLSPSELLKEEGTANQKWTGSPTQFNYTLSGEGEEVWSPRFTYTGFRYVQVEGAVPEQYAASGEAALLRIEGQMIYPDMAETGSFESADFLLNRTHELINWAVLSNTKSVFTDCPHREKLAWLEQVHLVGPGIVYNYDVEALFTKVMEDIRDAQLPNGMVPTTAPEYVVFSDEWRCFRDSVSWGATYVLTAWNLYTLYGNSRVMTEHYDGMKAYLDYIAASSESLIVNWGLGDWYDVAEGDPGFAKNTPVGHTETAMFYHLADVFSQMAELLGRKQDALAYRELQARIKSAFNAQYFDTETLRYATGSETATAMPLVLGLADEPHREALLSQLIEAIQQNGYHTKAGDVGHRYVLLALAQNGRSDVIYEMTRQTDHPSYGYQIVNGATTLTEAWDGPTVGKSQNHFMLGHLEEWLYAFLGGIRCRFDQAEEVYQITIRPFIPAGLETVKTEHQLSAGRVCAQWKQHPDGKMAYNVAIPVNCTAEVWIPAASAGQITEGGLALAEAKGIEAVRQEEGSTVLRLGSGEYRFLSTVIQ